MGRRRRGMSPRVGSRGCSFRQYFGAGLLLKFFAGPRPAERSL